VLEVLTERLQAVLSSETVLGRLAGMSSRCSSWRERDAEEAGSQVSHVRAPCSIRPVRLHINQQEVFLTGERWRRFCRAMPRTSSI